MALEIHKEGGFEYIEEGEGQPLLLLHGLFGALSNWDGVIDFFKEKYKVIIPLLPIYTMPLKSAGVKGLVKFVEGFVDMKQLKDVILIGNSLGGHIALEYSLNNSDNVKKMILTGSSGLFENTMGGSFPKRGNYEFIEEKVKYTFYDPNTATKELIDYVYNVVNSSQKCLRIIAIARSAQKHNMAKDLPNIHIPTLLVWGLNDTITPPEVAHEFDKLLPNTKLHFIDKCGHAPMMEHPQKFNEICEPFLNQ